MCQTDFKGCITIQAAGIIRHMDNAGRLVIPKEYRDQFQIGSGNKVEILGTDEGLLVRPVLKKE